jgi:hypothetical protein
LKPLISVHVAKAGGTSVKATLPAACGGRLAEDYADNPTNSLSARILAPRLYISRNEPLPAGASYVHGHFHPGKYAISRNTAPFTTLSYPVDNIISIYWFWKTISQETDPLREYFLKINLTVIETAQLPCLLHLFSITYFGGFDMTRFDVIGRQEKREAALAVLAVLGGTPLNLHLRENIAAPNVERQEMGGPWVRQRIEDILVDDIKFYERYAR